MKPSDPLCSPPREPPIPRWIERLFVGSALSLSGIHLVRLVAAVSDPTTLIGATAGALVGYVLADLVSGVVHWAFDRLGTRDTPLIGEAFIQSFRYHHVDPADIRSGDFINTNGKNCIAVLPILTAGLWLPVGLGALVAFGLGALVAFGLGVVMTNQIHKWAHTEDPGPLVGRLQRWGLILCPEHHDRHHRWPHDRNYCITSGWCNPACERLGVFVRGERLLRRLGVAIFEG